MSIRTVLACPLLLLLEFLLLSCKAQSSDEATVCSQGTFSVETSLMASGFDYPDGTIVRATFGRDAPQDMSASLVDGAFSLSFNQPSETCSLGATREEPAAFYIDANGDGTCTLADDYAFVWIAESEHGSGTPSVVGAGFPVSPDSKRCPMSARSGAEPVVVAMRRLCPEIGSCIPFCSPPAPGTVNRANTLACPVVDAIVVDAGSLRDASALDAGP